MMISFYPLGAAVVAAQNLASSGAHYSCPADSPASCSVYSDQDSCCYEASNGIFLQTQFWDYSPATGPSDAWTVHGLWSDKCSGGYDQFCQPSWQITSAKATLERLGLNDVVSYMSTVWKNQGAGDDDLWTHEFNKHGTCMSTVSPSCYPDSAPLDSNVGDLFKSVLRLYDSLPTYKWLSEAGIEPSTDKTWTVDEFTCAIIPYTDCTTVYLGCDKNNAINEIWYFYSLEGSVADGTFASVDSVSPSTCKDGFKYLPKTNDGGGDGDGQQTSGYLNIVGGTGCLISDGSWYASGTCATYKATTTIGGISLTSSKGPCAIVDGTFKCGPSVTSSDFTLDSNNYLTYGGSSEWSASTTATGTERVAVRPGTSGAITFKIKLT